MNMKKIIINRTLHAKATPAILKNAQLLRQDMTLAEKILWNELRNKKLLGIKFRRQHALDQYVADFYYHELKLVIEIDGGIHLNVEQRKKDRERSTELAKIDISVMRLKNEDIFKRLEWTLEQIKKQIKKSSPLGEDLGEAYEEAIK